MTFPHSLNIKLGPLHINKAGVAIIVVVAVDDRDQRDARVVSDDPDVRLKKNGQNKDVTIH